MSNKPLIAFNNSDLLMFAIFMWFFTTKGNHSKFKTLYFSSPPDDRIKLEKEIVRIYFTFFLLRGEGRGA